MSLRENSKTIQLRFIKVNTIPVVIDHTCCTGCGDCVKSCRYGVFEKLDETPEVAHIQFCKDCGTCVEDCPTQCISFRND
ncbi:MAG: 4Fe-4S dicluster domain-containing protein [Candidatus Thorarchaeota archaeon]|nr:MAG: 4Fe-4S dicluster domain-containing protein [Candidatus Thorarchaeota archaeon]